VNAVRRLADNLNTTVGFLLGESEDLNIFKDPSILKWLNEINKLPEEKKHMFFISLICASEILKLKMFIS